MLSSTARGLPRFYMTRDRPSSSTRRRSLPKFARASKAVTTIPSFINSPFRLIKLYSSRRIDVNSGTGPTKQLTHFTSGEVWDYGWSPDGKFIALARGTDQSDAVLFTSAK